MAKLIDLDGLAYFYGKIKAMLADKLGKNDTAVNASKVNNLTVETAVPKNAKFTDTVYTHPSTHPASMITGLSTVATSGSYSDLSNKPTIPVVPTKVSAFINDAGYLTQHQSLEYEKYVSYVISGAANQPASSVMQYTATGAFTLNLSSISSKLAAKEATVFTTYIKSDADYTLTITNAGTIKYIGSASDVAITSAGLLLNIMMLKDVSGNVTSIVQASKLS